MVFDKTQFNYSSRQQNNEGEKIKFFSPTPEEKILLNGKIVSKNRLKGSSNEVCCDNEVYCSNEVYCVEFKDDGKGIFKPREGETDVDIENFPLDRKNTPRETYYLRERATCLVDRFLGFNLVPPTVIREIDGQTGSVQQFIPDTKEYYRSKKSPLKIPAAIHEQLLKMFILDHIIFNSDRNGGNFLRSNDNKIYAIDHGLSFGNEKLEVFPDNIPDYSKSLTLYDRPIPNELIEQFKMILANTEKQKELDKLLRDLLSDEDREAFFVRLNRIGKLIIEKGCIPNPDKADRRNPNINVKQYN